MSPAREYQIIALDAANIDDAIKDPKLAALRAQGYHVVASLGVAVKDRPCLALIMEPPLGGSEPLPEKPVVFDTQPTIPNGWKLVYAIIGLLGIGQIIAIALAIWK